MSKDERKVNPIQEMLRLVRDHSELEARGFRESYRSDKDQRLIYDSEWCRIKLVWAGWDYGSGNTISVYYGRLHAPEENVTMVWNGEECYAWHDIDPGLHFLDGRSPVDAAKMRLSTSLTGKYFEDDFRQIFYRRQPEWLITMHMEVWEHYGQRFFELFDLRRPDLWERYRQFLEEYYDIKGRSAFIDPSLDKVC
jgi:hypothetical protein